MVETGNSHLSRRDAEATTMQSLEKRMDKGEFFRHNWPLYCRWTLKQYHGEEVEQLVLPALCQKTVFKMAHTIPFAGHMGRYKTARRIQ